MFVADPACQPVHKTRRNLAELRAWTHVDTRMVASVDELEDDVLVRTIDAVAKAPSQDGSIDDEAGGQGSHPGSTEGDQLCGGQIVSLNSGGPPSQAELTRPGRTDIHLCQDQQCLGKVGISIRIASSRDST